MYYNTLVLLCITVNAKQKKKKTNSVGLEWGCASEQLRQTLQSTNTEEHNGQGGEREEQKEGESFYYIIATHL